MQSSVKGAHVGADKQAGTTADRVFGEAEAAYRGGDRVLARKKLDQALALDKRHARANWLLGNLTHDEGALDKAITLYRRALRADGSLVEARNDLGTAYHAKGWYAEAEQCYREVIERQAGHIAAMENLATALRAQGKLRDARDAYLRVLGHRVRGFLSRLVPWRTRAPQATAVAPKEVATHAVARQRMAAGAHREAAEALYRSLADRPDDAEAHFLLGQCLLKSEDAAGAQMHFETAVRLRSSVPEFHLALGNVLADTRQYLRALQCFEVAVALDPGFAPAIANTAKVLHELGHYREAEKRVREALDAEPERAVVHSNLSGVLVSLGEFREAEAAARKALEIAPDLPQARIALARALAEQARYDEARALAEQVLASGVHRPVALNLLASTAMVGRADLDEAQRYVEASLAEAPEGAGTQIMYAQILLHRRRFAEGWEYYECRKRMAERAPIYRGVASPEWDGSPLNGRSLLICAEQGLGDEIMFASCFRDAARNAGRCAVCCTRKLEALFRRSFPEFEIVPGSHTSPSDRFPVLQGFDVHVFGGSLPRLFRKSAADFPSQASYLRADPAKAATWRARLQGLGGGLKVGISWRGGTPMTGSARRTLALGDLAGLLRVPNVHWVSLQYGDCGDEVAEAAKRLGVKLTHWQEAVDDLDETAALIEALDLRISACNTQVHLSGALGREVWVLAPRMPDWRYGYEGESMLWYPSARMFRQAAADDWSAPLAAIEADLRKRAAG